MSSFLVIQKAFIINPKWQTLIMKRGESDIHWDLPGGRLEHGQSLKQSLTEIVLHETNLRLTTVSIPLNLTSYLDPADRNHQIVRVTYLCVGEGKAESPHHQDTLEWITISDYQKYQFPDESYAQTFENYLSHSKLASIEFLGSGMLEDSISYLKQSTS